MDLKSEKTATRGMALGGTSSSIGQSLLLGASLLLFACSNEQTNITPVAAEPDIVSVKLSQAADKAAAALDSIASIEQQRAPATPPMEDYSHAPPALKQPITVRWSGPIEQIGKALADRAGMQFRVTGIAPPAPVTVSLDVYQMPLVEVLKSVGLQAGQRADLAVDGRAGVIEIRYAPIDHS